MRLTVKLFVICIAFFGSQIGFASQCIAFLGNAPAVTRSPFKPGVQKLLEAGRWLRVNAHSVNPRTTHLESFKLVVIDLQEKIGTALPTKTGEVNYSTYAPLLQDIMKEIEIRVVEKKITYEWLFGLPIRIGFLLKMDGDFPMFLRKKVDPEFMSDPSSYATHESFLQLLNKVEQFEATRQGPRSALAGLHDQLQEFPKQRLIPYFGGINVRELNHLVADESWPIGITSKKIYVDSILHDEFAFPIHDAVHASLRYRHLDKEQIPTKLVNSVERDVLKQIERSSLSDQDFKVQHYVHFVVFHEGMASDFALIKDGKWTDELSRQTMKEGFANTLRYAASPLITRFEGIPHLYEDLRKIAKFSDEQEAKQSIERNIADYMKKIELAVDRSL